MDGNNQIQFSAHNLGVSQVVSVGFSLRLCASAIDFAILLGTLGASFSLVAQLAIWGRLNPLVDFIALALGLLTLSLPPLYFWLFTWRTGQTLGKRFVGIVVVSTAGEIPLFGQSFLREVVGKLLVVALGITMPLYYLWFLRKGRDRGRREWHDILAGTYLIKASPNGYIPRPSGLSWKCKREIGSRVTIGAVALLVMLLVVTFTIDYFPVARGYISGLDDRSSFVSEPLDAQFVDLGDEMSQSSKAEWQRLLSLNDHRASIVPLMSLDPTKDPIVFIPGIGVNFQDAHAIAQLGGEYQVAIGIYNQRYPLDRNGQHMADAIEEFGSRLRELAAIDGVPSKSELKVIGHSLGGLVATLALDNLAERENIGDHRGSLFDNVEFVQIDAPWRGFDAPWIFTLPGVKHVLRGILPWLPLPNPTTRSALSVVNRTSSMNAVINASLPNGVNVHIVSVIPDPETLRSRPRQPVDGWNSMELGEDDLALIRAFFSSNREDLNKLDRWRWGLGIRTQSIHQLLKTLERDRDYSSYEGELRSIAIEAETMDQFRTSYDSVIGKIVKTFHGQHTHFMWEDKTFLPWLSGVFQDRHRQ